MSSHADVPSEAEPASLDDLVADCTAVRHLLDEAAGRLPAPRGVLTIPDSAVAVVSGLDAYGD